MGFYKNNERYSDPRANGREMVADTLKMKQNALHETEAYIAQKSNKIFLLLK